MHTALARLVIVREIADQKLGVMPQHSTAWAEQMSYGLGKLLALMVRETGGVAASYS